jgi:hypothetical protein
MSGLADASLLVAGQRTTAVGCQAAVSMTKRQRERRAVLGPNAVWSIGVGTNAIESGGACDRVFSDLTLCGHPRRAEPLL